MRTARRKVVLPALGLEEIKELVRAHARTLMDKYGIRVVGIFGSSDERATRPMGPHTRVVQHRVPCSPCLLRECPIDFRCMQSVTVDAAYQAVVDLIEEAGCYP